MSVDTADMVRKIEACLRLADDPGATPDEKRLAKDRAEHLMAKYQIDEAMMHVERKGQNKAADIVKTSFWIMGAGETFIPQQRLVLAHRIGVNMGCQAVIETRQPSADIDTGAPLPGGKYLTIMGFRNDVEAARNLYNLLVPAIALAVVNEKQTSPNYIKQFAEGFVLRVDERLAEMRRSVARKVKEEKGSSVALVLVEKGELVEKAFNEQYPNLRTEKHRADSTYDPNAQARGRKAADAADLGGGKGVGAGARKGLGS